MLRLQVQKTCDLRARRPGVDPLEERRHRFIRAAGRDLHVAAREIAYPTGDAKLPRPLANEPAEAYTLHSADDFDVNESHGEKLPPPEKCREYRCQEGLVT